jgi:hypothetical protein
MADTEIATKERQLSHYEVELREKFVKEYMFDKNPTKAAIRAGINATYADNYAKEFLSESKVQIMIKRKEIEASVAAADPERMRQDMIISLRQIMIYDGEGSNASARVAAAKQLAAMLGLEAPSKSETKVEFMGGVMITPATMTVDDWSAHAIDSQSKLHKQLESSI